MDTNETKEKEKEKEKEDKECLFSFGKINKYFIFPFLCPIICMFCNYLIISIIQEFHLENKQFFLSTFVNSTYIGGGLVYFISWIRTKTEETRDIVQIDSERKSSFVKYIYNEGGIQTDKFKIFLLLLYLSFLLAIFDVVDVYALGRNTFEERLYFLFFIPLFSKLTLKISIFKHQILSIFIGSIGLILLFIPVILVIEKEDTIINVCMFVSSIGYSNFLVLLKYLMNRFYFSPYLCLFFLGIFSIILNTIGFMIVSLLKYQNLSLIIDNFTFENIDSPVKLILYLCATFISASFLQIFSNLVIYYFSPILLMVTDSISPMLLWIFLILPEEEKAINIVFNASGYLISLISSLIYNEIIILNFCGFNKYTKKYILKRQQKETYLLRDTENSIKTGNVEEENNDASFDEENEDNKSN
jgi:hypothetical protein